MLYLRHTLFYTQGLTRAQKRAHGSAAAHALLTDLLTDLDLPQALEKNAQGRPFLAACPTVDFNLSHTEELAVCALLQCENTPRIGVDAEALRVFDDEKAKAFAARFFAPYEQQHLAAAHDRAACFTRIFTRKEAYAKYCGDGLGKHLRTSDTLAPDFESAHGVRFYTYLHENTFITLCVPQSVHEKPITTLSAYTK